MNKFKIDKCISRITRVKLQATIEESIACDLALLGEWSNNDKNYVVSETSAFALSQDSEFEKFDPDRHPDRRALRRREKPVQVSPLTVC
jgi:hypothetical protein